MVQVLPAILEWTSLTGHPPPQAQKEELQSLMQQPRALEEENARLRGALQDGEASQRALESELQASGPASGAGG